MKMMIIIFIFPMIKDISQVTFINGSLKIFKKYSVQIIRSYLKTSIFI